MAERVVTHSVMGKQVHDAKLVALMQLYGIALINTVSCAHALIRIAPSPLLSVSDEITPPSEPSEFTRR
jgi:hypothetical protein